MRIFVGCPLAVQCPRHIKCSIPTTVNKSESFTFITLFFHSSRHTSAFPGNEIPVILPRSLAPPPRPAVVALWRTPSGMHHLIQ